MKRPSGRTAGRAFLAATTVRAPAGGAGGGVDTVQKRFILHMGLPKCASTSLQDTLPHATRIGYLGKTTAGAFADPLIAEFTRVIAVFGDVRLRNCAPHRAALEKAFAECPHDTLWLSDEVLSSAGFAAYGQSNSLPQILENFKRVAPAGIEPVIVVRNQHSLLRSYFRQWVGWGSAETYEEFIRLIFLRRDRFLFPVLNYVALVRVLQGIVPKGHVLCFEALTRDGTIAANAWRRLASAISPIFSGKRTAGQPWTTRKSRSGCGGGIRSISPRNGTGWRARNFPTSTPIAP